MTAEINRRSLIAMGIGAAGSVALPSIPAAAATDAELEGLSGLTLAAVHIERAIAAMADVQMGRWSVRIVSGDADQNWAFHQEFNTVRRAIAVHERCYDAVDELIDQCYEIEAQLQAKPTYELLPKVQVGRRYKGLNDDGSERHEPIYAYDLATVDNHCQDWQRAFEGWRPDNVEVARVLFASKRDQLRKAIARKKRMEQRAGLTAKRRELTAAYHAVDRAAVAVMMTKPGNAQEAAERRAYIRRRHLSKASDWQGEDLLPIMLSIVEGGHV
jgi:hypothetical protein